MNYLILKTVVPDGICRLSPIKNVPNDHWLKIGRPYPGDFPEEAMFEMNEEFPKDIRLADSLRNITSLLVVSEKFRAALAAVPGALFENAVFPVKIVNHKGRTEKARYFIIHQMNHPACLDEKKSKGTKSSLNRERFQSLEKMVLDEKKIPADLMLFRPAQYYRYPLIRTDLAESLQKVGLTGVEFHAIAGYEF